MLKRTILAGAFVVVASSQSFSADTQYPKMKETMPELLEAGYEVKGSIMDYVMLQKGKKMAFCRLNNHIKKGVVIRECHGEK